MPEPSSIETYVSSLTAEGELHSQSQDFSISEEAALAKLSGVLEDKQHWILKAVQAGVAAQCRAMSVKIGKTDTTIVWYGLAPMEASVLKTALCQSHPTNVPFIDELVTGLRALLGVYPFQFGGLGILTGSEDKTLALEDQNLQELTLRVEHPGDTVLGFRSRSQRETAAEQAKLLYQRCLFCPIPIKLDGRRIQTEPEKSLRRFHGKHFAKSPLPLMDLETQKNLSTWELSSPPQIPEVFSVRKWDNLPVVNKSGASGCRGRFLVWMALEEYKVTTGSGKNRTTEKRARVIEEPVTVHWLRHGVTCGVDTIYSHRSLGAALALDAGDAKTDLSGLAIGERPLSEHALRDLFSDLYGQAQKPLAKRLMQPVPSFGFPLLREIPYRIFYAFGGSMVAMFLGIGLHWLICMFVTIPDEITMRVAAVFVLVGAIVGFFVIPDNPYTDHVKKSMKTLKSF